MKEENMESWVTPLRSYWIGLTKDEREEYLTLNKIKRSTFLKKMYGVNGISLDEAIMFCKNSNGVLKLADFDSKE